MFSLGFSVRTVNIILFALLTLTWGFTWFASKILVTTNTTLMPEILASYRFTFAGIILFIVAKAFNLQLKPSRHELKTFIIASAFGCSINLFLFYYAAFYLISGFSSVVFSMIIILNLIIGSFFGVKQVNFLKVFILAALGMVGLYFIIVSHSGFHGFFTRNILIGLLLGFLATLSFSISSTYYQTRQNINLHPVTSFAYMCIFGACWCILMGFTHSLLSDIQMNFIPEISFNFIIAFLYLSIFGTAIGYLCSFTLVRRIGSVKTGYSSLITPLFSIGVSFLWEKYNFSFLTVIGLALIIISEFLALNDKNIK
jgi:drug/metabolite transporter (DMT)-like permease